MRPPRGSICIIPTANTPMRNHIRYLRRDLAKKGYRCSEDVAHYKEHGEISLYFPEFLLHSVEEILCRQSA